MTRRAFKGKTDILDPQASFGGIGQSGACFTLTIRDRASAVPPGIPRLAPARFLTSTLSRHAIPRFVLNSSRKRQFFVSNRSAASAV